MVKAINKGKTEQYVYDISLDGTVVNALGCNVVSNTDGFNFSLPDEDEFRYTDENPYIGLGLNRNVVKGKKYTGFKADVAEFNDLYMRKFMGLGIDEVVDATINFSRKNYADYFPENAYPEDVKKVGNTIKSKKMPDYIAKFLDKGIRLLLQENGKGFLDEYYKYVSKIYNYEIPLKEIASKGKVKKTIEDYMEDCKTYTKSGSLKSRQAWMELAKKENMKVDMGDVIYYYNTGTKKKESDVKRIEKYYKIENNELFGEEKVDITKQVEKEWKKYSKQLKEEKGIKTNPKMMKEWLAKEHPEIINETVVNLNCSIVKQDIINSEIDVFCDDSNRYNSQKYIEQFNNRIKALLVCFSDEIRNRILINNPKDRPYFTEKESELSSGIPNKPSDQDTFEQLMTMEDKEIKFWEAHPEFEIPFEKECDMDWNTIHQDYLNRKEREKQLGIDIIRESYEKCINEVTSEELTHFMEEGIIPAKIEKLIDVNPVNGTFVAKNYPDIIIGTVNDFIYRFNGESDDYDDGYIEE